MSRTSSRHHHWKSTIPMALLAALLAIPTIAGSALAAYQGTIDSNTSAFNPPCTAANSYPAKLRDAAAAAYAALNYAPAVYSGPAFTRSQVLARTVGDYGYYVHSHGDLYRWGTVADSGFRADGGSCSGAIVNAGDIKLRRAGRISNLVVMSTCHLGETAATMSEAFGIPEIKYRTTWGGNRFYVGYLGVAWDSDEWIFEQAFWSALRSGNSVGVAFDIAKSKGFYHAFTPNWWGSYTYRGFGGPYTSCTACS
jgi:hypothetical protein